MLELALKGRRGYFMWILFLIAVLISGFFAYLHQLENGLSVTALSRDVSWGFYVSQLTFLVGVAASAVMLVLPYYLHDFKAFGPITIIGEFTAVASICMCLLFLLVDLGMPQRCLNVFLHPTPGSMIFWDSVVLTGYLLLNLITGWNVLQAQRNNVSPGKWVKFLIYLSIPWAFTIHTVTAFLYCGLPGRGFWMTAILAPRFLASAFASGPGFLILICFILKKFAGFDAGKEAVQGLAKITLYGLIANLFFFSCEVFVVFYSKIPHHMDHFIYLYKGLHGKSALVPYMITSLVLMGTAVFMLIIPKLRQNEKILPFTAALVFIGTWIDKGFGLIPGGFIPSPLHEITEYLPTLIEIQVSFGVLAIGGLLMTGFFKIYIEVKNEF